VAARLRLLVPEGTTNYITNPAARFVATGATAVGATVTRTLTEARFGVASFRVVTNGAALHEGFYYRVNDLAGIQDVLTVSAYVRGPSATLRTNAFVRIRLIDNPIGREWVSQRVELLADRWQRVEVMGRCSGSNDVRLYLETDGEAAQSVTFYADGLQMERQEEATTYCDGDQSGCRWTLLEHGSQSIRSPYTRAGGRWVEIAGPKCEEQGLYMTVIGGMGTAPMQNQIQPYADAPGAYFQNVKVLSRPITLSFHAKVQYRHATKALPSLRALHKLREQLLDVVKPDKTAGAEAFTLEYQDGEIPLYLKVRYDGGMEGEWDVRNAFVNSFPMRLLAVSPLFTEDDREVDALNFRSRQTINYIVGRVDGEWSEMNGGFDAQVRELEVGSRGEIIAVGDFSLANNKVGAINPMIFANHIAYWDGEQWRGYGSGANTIIRAVAIAPNGYIYVTGDFTSIGGVACNRVAYWNGTTWNAMGSGLNGIGYTIKVAPNGDVYVGGAFTTAGGIAAPYFARWRTGTWSALGAGGLDGLVYSIDISQDGAEVAIGGQFTTDLDDLNYAGIYDPAINQIYALGSGFDTYVRKMLFLPSGRLYAGGDFTEDNDGNLTLLYVAYWNGASWSEVGVGANNTVRDLAVSPRGNILLGGDFTVAGSSDSSYVALWNEASWVNLDVELGNAVYAVALDKKENMFVAPNGTLADFAAITTIENIGSAETNPTVYIVGPCTLKWIENQTTQKRVYTDLDIAQNEEVIIDFSQGTVMSNVRGNLAYAINPGSDLRAWTLVPGDNKIAVLMTEDVAATLYISYVPRHWSVDATARVEEL